MAWIKEDIAIKLEKAIDTIMCQAERDEGITTGDITPYQTIKLNQHIDDIASLLMEVLNQNK